jgi:hypothetical protein
LIVVNAGVANKSAAATAAALTPESYCMALLSAKSVKFHSKPYPRVTTEQEDFCNQIEAKETH